MEIKSLITLSPVVQKKNEIDICIFTVHKKVEISRYSRKMKLVFYIFTAHVKIKFYS